ncbi:MAG: hypothetical protein LUH63_03690 [Parabacteroides sp.]|nr:hypothetical protein [Parabacteroides sp.]
MKEEQFNSVIRLVIALLGGILLMACSRETDMPAVENYRPVELTINMSVAGYLNSGNTRTPVSPLPGDLGGEENSIHNITVFQFDGTGGDNDPLVMVRYADSNLGNLSLGFMQSINDPNKQQLLYFVANTGKELQNFSGTYGDLKKQLISVNERGKSDGIMPMTASLTTAINAQQEKLTIKFARRLAKINVTCLVTDGFSFIPARLQLRNVPVATCVASSSETVPEAASENTRTIFPYQKILPEDILGICPKTSGAQERLPMKKRKRKRQHPTGKGNIAPMSK